jgi:hypothetical protein
MITALIGPAMNIASTWLEGRVERTKAETGAKVAKAKAEAVIAEKQATGEIDWDLKMADASATICGDWGREIVAEGFAALEAMPTFYQYTLGTIVAASFGVRSATKFFGKK